MHGWRFTKYSSLATSTQTQPPTPSPEGTPRLLKKYSRRRNVVICEVKLFSKLELNEFQKSMLYVLLPMVKIK